MIAADPKQCLKEWDTVRLRPANDIEKSVAAAHAFLQGTAPFLSLGERVKDQGPDALNAFRLTGEPEKKKPRKKIRKRSTLSSGSFWSEGESSSESFWSEPNSNSSGSFW